MHSQEKTKMMIMILNTEKWNNKCKNLKLKILKKQYKALGKNDNF